MEVSSDVSAIARAEKLDSEEPLLMENPRRFVMFPIKHNDIWQFYKKAEGKLSSSVDSLVLNLNLLFCTLPYRHFFY